MLVKRMSELSYAVQDCSTLEKQQMCFEVLRNWETAASGWRRHIAWGLPLCRNAVCHILQMSMHMFRTITANIADGMVVPPRDLRKSKSNVGSGSSAPLVHANTMLAWASQQHLQSVQFIQRSPQYYYYTQHITYVIYSPRKEGAFVFLLHGLLVHSVNANFLNIYLFYKIKSLISLQRLPYLGIEYIYVLKD